MKVVSFIRLITITILVLIGLWGLWVFLSKPKLNSFQDMYPESEISYRKNYKKLVEQDLINGYSFLKNGAHYAVVFDNTFPYTKSTLTSQNTMQIILLLNDSSAYEWGEFGTPEHSQTIVFYSSNSTPVGYTQIDPMGEVENYPYRSLMKWGKLSKTSFNQLKELIK